MVSFILRYISHGSTYDHQVQSADYPELGDDIVFYHDDKQVKFSTINYMKELDGEKIYYAYTKDVTHKCVLNSAPKQVLKEQLI